MFNFRRNVPQRIVEKIGSPPTEGPIADIIKALQERINKFGLDSLYVGELVREAIEYDWPYIFIDTEHEATIDRALRRDQAGLRPHPRRRGGASLSRSDHGRLLGT